MSDGGNIMTATDITFTTPQPIPETTSATLSRIEDVARITLADTQELDRSDAFATLSF
jgi:hypothetical protein